MKINRLNKLKVFILLLENIFIILCTYIFIKYKGSFIKHYIEFNFLFVFTIAIAFCATIYIFKFEKLKEQNHEFVNDSKEVIDSLRCQKHDFKNHLSIIVGLIQLNKIDKAKDYIFSLDDSIEKSFTISKLENLEFSSLIYKKINYAENHNIEVDLSIDYIYNDVDISTLELCRIASNLLDNAIYELERSKETEKILTINITKYENMFILAIGNSTPYIEKEKLDRLFQKGFTTKKNSSKDSRGYGLSIVKKLVNKNSGKIEVESYEGLGTIFTVFLPISK